MVLGGSELVNIIKQNIFNKWIKVWDRNMNFSCLLCQCWHSCSSYSNSLAKRQKFDATINVLNEHGYQEEATRIIRGQQTTHVHRPLSGIMDELNRTQLLRIRTAIQDNLYTIITCIISLVMFVFGCLHQTPNDFINGVSAGCSDTVFVATSALKNISGCILSRLA